jgi:hypothetical protein
MQEQDWVLLASSLRCISVVDLTKRGIGVGLLDERHHVYHVPANMFKLL